MVPTYLTAYLPAYCLYTSLAHADWTDVISSTSVDLSVDLFYSKLNNILGKHVPDRNECPNVSSPKRQYPPWFDAEIKSKLKIKYFHLKKFKLFGLSFNLEVYKYYRSHIKELISKAHKTYIEGIERNICIDPSTFWKYVKGLKKDSKTNAEFTYNGVTVSGQEAADAFADYFSSVFVARVPRLDADDAARAAAATAAPLTVSISTITEKDIRDSVRGFNTAAAPGPDAVPTFLVKDCIHALIKPLLHLYNLAVQSCEYPTAWKLSRVTPVPKSSSINVPEHRPIAVLSVFAKLFEHILNKQITRQIEPYLDDSQHGFRVGRSATTNHICFVDSTLSEMDAGYQVDTAFFDFRKAFDVVNNDLLLIKLASFGFDTGLLKFIASYLANRRQYVKLGPYCSDDYHTRSGVSQGSTIGPTLFALMVNDLPKVLQVCKCLMYADDLKIYTSIKSTVDCESLQQDIDAIGHWSELNDMNFNVDKCRVMTFGRLQSLVEQSYTLLGCPIQRVEEIRDLGVLLDPQLSFRNQILACCKSANKTLGYVMRTASHFSDTRVAMVLYNSFVRSKLEFDAITWGPYEAKYIVMMERLQRKFARYLFRRVYGYYPFLYPSLFVIGMVGMETLEVRRAVHTVVHYLRLLRGGVDNPAALSGVGLWAPTRGGRPRRAACARPPALAPVVEVTTPARRCYWANNAIWARKKNYKWEISAPFQCSEGPRGLG
ncbi:unnamed protein product [Plutella xylostella]|uniref:(diamondback moth) hypothetical protein n=1 Tax=Plutella xylostella TaxID=51655 RepID=A0A8S4G309_PLUXY|nr:unnamed protein product [Plutella xylostella]